MVAAMMTAANLGARTTGWGFIIFTLGSISWSIAGASTGQINLLATNAFLTLVNAIGIWRWLGRQRSYEDGGKSAERASRRSAAPTLFTATGIQGIAVVDASGDMIGKAVEALLGCERGDISYVVIRSANKAGLHEELRAVASGDLEFSCERLTLRHDSRWFADLPVLDDGKWPATPPEASVHARAALPV